MPGTVLAFQALLKPLSLLLFGFALLFPSTTHAVSPAAVQANFGDVSYAGGMAWDPVDDVLYVTGQVGKNGCYTAVLKRSNLQFISKQLLPEPAVCQSVAMVSVGGAIGHQTSVSSSWTWLLATTDEGGLMTDMRESGSDKAEQYGLVLPVHWNAAGTATLPPGLLLHEDLVQTPRAIVSDPAHGSYIYVASLHSDDGSTTESFNSVGIDVTPNLTPGGMKKYGSEFFLTVERLRYEAVNSHKLEPGWRKPFGLLPSPSGKPLDVELATMLWNNGALVIFGSTKGSGQAYGESPDPAFSNGFITKLDPTTGTYWGQGGESASSKYRYLFKGLAKVHTHVVGACQANENDDSFYLVGHVEQSRNETQATQNAAGGSKKAASVFATKIDAATLEPIWEQEFPATTSSYGFACGVDGANNALYVGGVVKDGGNVDGTQSFGDDDILIAQLSTNDGSANWIKQVGTSGTDILARGDGGLIVTTDGIVVMGDTSGDFGAQADREHEIFVLNVGLDGGLPIATEASGPANKGGNAPLLESTLQGESQTSDGGTGTGGDNGTDNGTQKPGSTKPPKATNPEAKSSRKGTGAIGIFVVVGILFFFLAVGYAMLGRKRETGTERALVFSYLQAFEVEDVDVRQSATGGWHGTYVGKLAQGDKERPHSHSSIVTDCLFVDYDTKQKKDDDLEDGFNDAEDREEDDANWETADVPVDGLSFTEGMDNLSDAGSGDGDPWGKEII